MDYIVVMGCNCKKTARAAARYADGEDTERVPYAVGVLNIIRTVFIIISVFVLIIITLPISLPVGVVSMFRGNSVRIDRLIRRKRGKKQDI